MIFWVIIFGMGFFLALRAQKAEALVKKSPNHPEADKVIALIGIFYLQAAVLIGLFPFIMKDYTDNILVHLAVWIPSIMIALGTWAEYNRRHLVANQWMKRAFFAVLIGIVVSSFMVPAEDYSFDASGVLGQPDESNGDLIDTEPRSQGSRSGNTFP